MNEDTGSKEVPLTEKTPIKINVLDQPDRVKVVLSNTELPTPFNENEHNAKTARRIATILVLSLIGSFLLHYGAILIIFIVHLPSENGTLEVWVSKLDSAFNVWLPIISGLAGGAVTYYFTKVK